MQQTAFLPFSQTLWLWRRYRGLTQAELARRAGIPRPNLSAIERGRREITLGTLRALAVGLATRPGLLVDGVAPSPHPRPRSRMWLERIANAVVHDHHMPDADDQVLVEALRQITSTRRHLQHSSRRRTLRGGRASQAAWLWLVSAYPPNVMKSLLERIAERADRDRR